MCFRSIKSDTEVQDQYDWGLKLCVFIALTVGWVSCMVYDTHYSQVEERRGAMCSLWVFGSLGTTGAVPAGINNDNTK